MKDPAAAPSCRSAPLYFRSIHGAMTPEPEAFQGAVPQRASCRAIRQGVGTGEGQEGAAPPAQEACRVRERRTPSLLGRKPLVTGRTPSPPGRRPSLLGTRPFRLGTRSSLVGRRSIRFGRR